MPHVGEHEAAVRREAWALYDALEDWRMRLDFTYMLSDPEEQAIHETHCEVVNAYLRENLG